MKRLNHKFLSAKTPLASPAYFSKLASHMHKNLLLTTVKYYQRVQLHHWPVLRGWVNWSAKADIGI